MDIILHKDFGNDKTVTLDVEDRLYWTLIHVGFDNFIGEGNRAVKYDLFEEEKCIINSRDCHVNFFGELSKFRSY